MVKSRKREQKFIEARPQESAWRRFIRVFFGRKIVLFGLIVVALYVIIAIFAPWLAPYDYTETDTSQVLLQPSSEHWLGTDTVGRDVLSRLIFGIRPTLIVGSVTILFASIAGTFLGLVAGYFGGWIQTIIMRCIDALMGFPMLLLALLVASLLGGGTMNVVIALGIGMIAAPCRMICGVAMSIKQNEYILAARAMGMKNTRLMLEQILPNAFPPLLVMMTIGLGVTILAEASLSFLGIGITPPTPAWGGLVNDGYKFLLTSPVLAISPGIAIMLVVFGFNMMGDGLRDALDPRLRGVI